MLIPIGDDGDLKRTPIVNNSIIAINAVVYFTVNVFGNEANLGVFENFRNQWSGGFFCPAGQWGFFVLIRPFGQSVILGELVRKLHMLFGYHGP